MGMGAKMSVIGIETNQAVTAGADAAGIKMYAGWTANESRLVLVHEDRMKAQKKLKTILPTGDQEGSDKEILIKKERALLTYSYEQTLNEKKAKPWIDTPYVWKKGDDTYAHVQTWTVNYNADFQKAFTNQKDENPNPELFNEAAVENFKTMADGVFGDGGRNLPIKYVQKKTKNYQPILVGTSAEFKKFLSEPGVKEALHIKSVVGNTVKVKIFNKSGSSASCFSCLPFGNCGTQDYTLGSDDTVQVLYWRKGFTQFWCFKTHEQFEKEGHVFGLIEQSEQ